MGLIVAHMLSSRKPTGSLTCQILNLAFFSEGNQIPSRYHAVFPLVSVGSAHA